MPPGAGQPSLRQGSAHNSRAELISEKQRSRKFINTNGKTRRDRRLGKTSFVRRRSWGSDGGVLERGCGGGRFAPSSLHGNGESARVANLLPITT